MQKQEGVERKLRGFEMIDRGIPRNDYELTDQDGNVIGRVTSGTMSPVLNKGIGMAYVHKAYSAIGTEVYLNVRGKALKAKIVKYSSRNGLSSISLIKGTDKELGLGDLKVDRLLLREVFHHLKDPESILKDISLHLKPDGYLIVEESTKELSKKGEERCNQATTYKKIMKEFGAAGYELEGLEISGSFYMLRFQHPG